MAVSKRLRYEVLRRDNHKCRYCGLTALETELTVDHVVPVALGGSDNADNLVAACKECNAGKSSAAADASLVSDVSTDAVRWSIAMRQVAAQAQAQRDELAAACDRFADVWDSYTFTAMQFLADIPDDWPNTVERMLAGGLTLEDLLDFSRMALTRPNLDRKVRFRYFCGIAWKVLTERQTAARELLAEHEAPKPPQRDGWGEYLDIQATALANVCDLRMLEELNA